MISSIRGCCSCSSSSVSSPFSPTKPGSYLLQFRFLLVLCCACASRETAGIPKPPTNPSSPNLDLLFPVHHMLWITRYHSWSPLPNNGVVGSVLTKYVGKWDPLYFYINVADCMETTSFNTWWPFWPFPFYWWPPFKRGDTHFFAGVCSNTNRVILDIIYL